MNRLLKIIHLHADDSLDPNGKTQVKNHGLISCASQVHIRHVPFDSPCIILVLSGRKVMFAHGREIVCEAGGALSVPSPGSFDLRNEPDPQNGRYLALVIPFQTTDLDNLRQMHGMALQESDAAPQILHFPRNPLLLDSIEHYLSSDTDSYLLRHKLLELLLILVQEDRRLLSYTLSRESWSQKVRAVLATDLSYKWEIGEICRHLATSESTLRRHLKSEQTGFRDLLSEQRLTAALMQLLQTSLPVTQIAYECGYHSPSRFSNNFSKRFGLPPSEFRSSLSENEHNLAVSEQLSTD